MELDGNVWTKCLYDGVAFRPRWRVCWFFLGRDEPVPGGESDGGRGRLWAWLSPW